MRRGRTCANTWTCARFRAPGSPLPAAAAPLWAPWRTRRSSSGAGGLAGWRVGGRVSGLGRRLGGGVGGGGRRLTRVLWRRRADWAAEWRSMGAQLSLAIIEADSLMLADSNLIANSSPLSFQLSFALTRIVCGFKFLWMSLQIEWRKLSASRTCGRGSWLFSRACSVGALSLALGSARLSLAGCGCGCGCGGAQIDHAARVMGSAGRRR